jgi:hypothetical protein
MLIGSSGDGIMDLQVRRNESGKMWKTQASRSPVFNFMRAFLLGQIHLKLDAGNRAYVYQGEIL